MENTMNSLIEKLGHQNTSQESDFIPDTEGGQRNYESIGGVDTSSMINKIRGVKSGLSGEEFDKSYVSFVNEDDSDYNGGLSQELNVNKMGGRGFLVEGGALEEDGYYGKVTHLGNPYDATGN